MGMFDWLTGKKSASTAQPINGGDTWRVIHEPTTGAWQRNQEIERYYFGEMSKRVITQGQVN